MEIESGIVKEPPFLIIYGQDGIGKSSVLAQVPNAVFAGPENRTQRLNVKRSKKTLDTYEKNIAFIQELLTEKHEFKNFCFESADWFEKILIAWIEADAGKPINDAYGGYGAGAAKLDEMTRAFVNLLKRLRDEKQMGIYVSAHPALKDFADPRTASDYTRFTLALRDRTADIWRQSVDAVIFCHYEVSKGKKDERAFSDGTRLFGTSWQSSYDAKNIFGMPEKIEMGRTPQEGFRNLMEALENSEPNEVEIVIGEINNLKHLVTDPKRLEKLEKVIEGKNLDLLYTAFDQLKALKG